MKRNASATWCGNLRHGKGLVTTGSGTLPQSQYFGIGDGKGTGTSPYELIAAAHAACFSITLAKELVSAGFTPQSIVTTATVAMERLAVGWTITGIELEVLAEAPRVQQGDFIEAAIHAKTRCTISRLLNTNISMSAKLANSESAAHTKLRPTTHSLKVSKTKKQSISRSPPRA